MKWSRVPPCRCITFDAHDRHAVAAAALTVRSISAGFDEMPGTIGLMSTPAFTPASSSSRTARSRWRGGAVPGSSARHTSSSLHGTLTTTLHSVDGGQLRQQVLVAHDHRALGDDARGVAARAAPSSAPARQLVVALDRLVAVGGGAERHDLARPRRPRQLAPQHLDEVGLHEDHRRELVAGAELELRVVAARVAVVAAVRAAAVRVQRPLEVAHPLDVVQRRPAAHLLVAGGVGAALGVGERRHAAGFTRSATRRVVGPAEIEEEWFVFHSEPADASSYVRHRA